MWESLAEAASFETESLILRPFAFSDAEDLFAIVSSAENTTFIYPPLPTLSACRTLLVQSFMRQPLGIWAIESKDSGQMIGAIRLENIQQSVGQAEIGYFLHRDYWRQGLMTQALNRLIFLAFRRFGMKKLIIKTHKDNLASQQLAEKTGFHCFRTYKGSDRHSHQMRNYKDYRYLKKDYDIKEKT